MNTDAEDGSVAYTSIASSHDLAHEERDAKNPSYNHRVKSDGKMSRSTNMFPAIIFFQRKKSTAQTECSTMFSLGQSDPGSVKGRGS